MLPGADGLSARTVNRALDRVPWARARLAVHAGQRFDFAVGPLDARFRIGADGQLEPAAGDGTAPDLRLRLSPFSLTAFLADPKRWNELVEETGDVALGGTLKDVAHTVPWLVEDAFARVFGAVMGTRIADTGRRLLALPGAVTERLADNVVTYARDEAGWLARGDEMRMLAAHAAALSVRLDALEPRLDALEPLLDALDARGRGESVRTAAAVADRTPAQPL